MANIRVMVSGSGYMGREVLTAVMREDGMEPVGVLEKFSSGSTISLPDGSGTVPLSQDADALVASVKPDVIVDFSMRPGRRWWRRQRWLTAPALSSAPRPRAGVSR